jgi:SM-20-related protein
MTSREMVDSFYESLMNDERILSVRERDLLVSLLKRTRDSVSGERDEIAARIARAVGEVVAQRAYDVLGENITRRLIESQAPFYATDSIRGGTQKATSERTGIRLGNPPVWPPVGNPGPRPPGPPSAHLAQVQQTTVAAVQAPTIVRADCVIFEEFLAPAEMNAVLQYAVERESSFLISEVIQPSACAGMISYEERRSRVLMDLGKHHQVIADRIHRCVPRVLEKLSYEPFEVSDIEAQITASNDGDYFRCHTDNGQETSSGREITFVYFFHREPKKFQGGELRIYDSRQEAGGWKALESYRSIIPQPNEIVFFASSLPHEITTLECSSRAFADSRFTVNGWLRR